MMIKNIFVLACSLFLTSQVLADMTIATSKSLDARVDVVGDKGNEWCDKQINLKFLTTDGNAISQSAYEQMLPKVQALLASQCDKLNDLKISRDDKVEQFSYVNGEWVSPKTETIEPVVEPTKVAELDTPKPVETLSESTKRKASEWQQAYFDEIDKGEFYKTKDKINHSGQRFYYNEKGFGVKKLSDKGNFTLYEDAIKNSKVNDRKIIEIKNDQEFGGTIGWVFVTVEESGTYQSETRSYTYKAKDVYQWNTVYQVVTSINREMLEYVDTTEPKLTSDKVETESVTGQSTPKLASDNNDDSRFGYMLMITAILLIMISLIGFGFYKIKEKIQEMSPGMVAGIMLLLMIPAYILPYYGSNSSVVYAAMVLSETIPFATYLHIAIYMAMTALMVFKLQGMMRLTAVFPVLAMLADMIPGINVIPLLPTLMFIFGMVALLILSKNQIHNSSIALVERIDESRIKTENNSIESVKIQENNLTNKQEDVSKVNDHTTRPVGIVSISILNAIGGLLLFIMGFLSFLGGSVSSEASGVIVGFITTALGVVSMVLAYGLWMFTDWGYKYTKILYIVSIVLALVVLITDFSVINLMTNAASIAISAWILEYLSKQHIASLFKK